MLASTEMDEKPDLDWIRPDDLLTLYLAELRREPLLTAGEEIELARQIERGHLAQRALVETRHSGDDVRQLEALVQAGQAARARFGRANMRLVVSIAKRYRGQGIPFTDLIQEGNVGLMRAVDRYDYRTGNRFSTYATWWIRQSVTRALSNNARVIRIPVHTGVRIRNMARVAQRLEMESGQRPTVEEIATELDESPVKVRQMMVWTSRPLSLEQPAGEDANAELQDFLKDESALLPEDMADIRILNETLSSLLKQLTAREVKILRLRYGLGGAQPHTLRQIGEKMSLSRERIRQIEGEALIKLRLFGGEQRLKQFL